MLAWQGATKNKLQRKAASNGLAASWAKTKGRLLKGAGEENTAGTPPVPAAVWPPSAKPESTSLDMLDIMVLRRLSDDRLREQERLERGKLKRVHEQEEDEWCSNEGGQDGEVEEEEPSPKRARTAAPLSQSAAAVASLTISPAPRRRFSSQNARSSLSGLYSPSTSDGGWATPSSSGVEVETPGNARKEVPFRVNLPDVTPGAPRQQQHNHPHGSPAPALSFSDLDIDIDLGPTPAAVEAAKAARVAATGAAEIDYHAPYVCGDCQDDDDTLVVTLEKDDYGVVVNLDDFGPIGPLPSVRENLVIAGDAAGDVDMVPVGFSSKACEHDDVVIHTTATATHGGKTAPASMLDALDRDVLLEVMENFGGGAGARVGAQLQRIEEEIFILD